MINSQDIIERSLYASLMRVALNLGITINPEDYLPLTTDNLKKQEEDLKRILKEKGLFVYIFGVGNNQSRGQKLLPRITIDLNGYYPGNIGLEQFTLGDLEDNEKYVMYETPQETQDTTLDIHLVANNSSDIRLLHKIMYTALPQRGYIKPFDHSTLKEYLADKSGLKPSGNLYLEVDNYYNHNDADHGIIEKVYTYNCVDSYVPETKIEGIGEISPIVDIEAILNPETAKSNITIQVP